MRFRNSLVMIGLAIDNEGSHCAIWFFVKGLLYVYEEIQSLCCR